MIYHRIILLLVVLSSALGLGAVAPCQRLLQGEDMAHASVGVHIVDVNTREVVASCNADRALMPASLVKLFTATAVMKSYNDDNRWHTLVGYTGSVVDGVLQGDVVVRGAIDPTLANSRSLQPTTMFVDSLLSALSRAGIRHITGSIVVDASLCTMGGWNEWMAEDMGFYYGAPCFGLNYKNNEYKLYLHTDTIGTRPRIIGSSMPTPTLHYLNHLTTATKDLSEVYITPYTPHSLLMGSVPAQRDSFALKCAMPDAPLFMAHDVHRALHDAGIRVDGEPVTDRMLREEGRSVPRMATLLYSHASDCLSDMVCEMLHKSNNLYAESLLRYVALTTDSIASLPRALAVERTLLSRMQLDTLAMTITDGSGLSRKNVATPSLIASLLVEAYHDEAVGSRLIDKLPQAGREGSVRSFMSRQPLPGVLRLKSGSMSGVLCYAGYYQHAGKVYAVVLMSNHHKCKNSTVRSKYERLLRDIFGSK